jgi:CRISPR/Cas system-associated exonuclease Cas4 (RecB family)
MTTLPVDRALAIYGTIANRSELKGTRERLSRHLRKVFIEGERDPHRLTVHGLTYLQDLDRERDS